MGYALLDPNGNLISWSRWDQPTPAEGETVFECETLEEARSANQLLADAQRQKFLDLDTWYARQVGLGVQVTLPVGVAFAPPGQTSVVLDASRDVILAAGIEDQNRFDAWTTNFLNLASSLRSNPLVYGNLVPIPFFDVLGNAIQPLAEQVCDIISVQYAGKIAALASQYVSLRVRIATAVSLDELAQITFPEA